MKTATPTSTLTYGCDLISQKLKFCLSPMGLLFKFETKPPKRPKPLAITVVLMICSTILLVIGLDVLLMRLHVTSSDKLELARESPFVVRLFALSATYRIVMLVATFLITIAQHGSIANLMAMRSHIVNKSEQGHFASSAFAVYLFSSLAKSLSFLPLYDISSLKLWEIAYIVPMTIMLNLVSLTVSAPIIYICYLGASLGKHVENFSELYVDTMFDQFMKAIETIERENSINSELDAASNVSSSHDGQDGAKGGNKLFSCLHDYLFLVIRFIKRLFAHMSSRLRRVALHLNSTKYPELPEMNMSKLSTATSLSISNSARIANSYLVRVRLRKTQIMLSELRDVVSDINKMSSPIVLMDLVYDALQIILITTSSIQTKTYKSINFMMLPTVSSTLCLVVKVVYICICLDATTSQLKLMINKLFDFIIMNHRVHTSDSPEHPMEEICMVRDSKNNSRLARLAADKEDEAISETWSQFQYTRLLANKIQFTMGGILMVTRRLALALLGHILSAVFISIEIMSIVDTSGEHGSHEPLLPSPPLGIIGGHHT